MRLDFEQGVAWHEPYEVAVTVRGEDGESVVVGRVVRMEGEICGLRIVNVPEGEAGP